MGVQDFWYSEKFRHPPTSGQRVDGSIRGLVAQEVENVLPSAVYTQKEDEQMADGSSLKSMKLVDMQPITVEMIGAVRALAKRVHALSSRAQRLQEKLAQRDMIQAGSGSLP